MDGTATKRSGIPGIEPALPHCSDVSVPVFTSSPELAPDDVAEAMGEFSDNVAAAAVFVIRMWEIFTSKIELFTQANSVTWLEV